MNDEMKERVVELCDSVIAVFGEHKRPPLCLKRARALRLEITGDDRGAAEIRLAEMRAETERLKNQLEGRDKR